MGALAFVESASDVATPTSDPRRRRAAAAIEWQAREFEAHRHRALPDERRRHRSRCGPSIAVFRLVQEADQRGAPCAATRVTIALTETRAPAGRVRDNGGDSRMVFHDGGLGLPACASASNLEAICASTVGPARVPCCAPRSRSASCPRREGSMTRIRSQTTIQSSGWLKQLLSETPNLISPGKPAAAEVRRLRQALRRRAARHPSRTATASTCSSRFASNGPPSRADADHDRRICLRRSAGAADGLTKKSALTELVAAIHKALGAVRVVVASEVLARALEPKAPGPPGTSS